MTKRWNVHHGSENLGLKTAKEIREALRKGTLDPFDKVSAEGSNIREDLIEVDEIFKETQDEDDSVPAQGMRVSELSHGTNSGTGTGTTIALATGPVRPANSGSGSGAGSGINTGMNPSKSRVGPPPNFSASFAADPNQPRTNPPPTTAGGVPLSWRTDQSADFREQVDSKSNQKRYYLIDKSKILGPLSGLEIQSLYNRGVLGAKVKVQRIGGTRSIPVAQFIASYSEDRLKELTEDGKLNQKVSSPSSKVLNELSRVANAQKIAQGRKNKTYLIMLLSGLILGVLLFVVVDSSRSSKRSDDRDKDDGRRGSRPKLLQQSPNEGLDDNEDEGSSPRRSPKANRASPPSPKANRPAVKPEPVLVERPSKAPAKPPKKSPAVAPAASAPAAAPLVVKAPPTKTVAPVTTPAPKKVVDKEGAIARAVNSNARSIQKIGPLSFSMGALDSCPSKCSLVFRDLTGATIKAVFFKSAYYEQLKKSSGSVYLTGNARREGGEATIFIQDIQ